MSNEIDDGITAEILPIIKWPHESLQQVAGEVTVFDKDLQQMIINMVGTCNANDGIGLAAPQVGINKRIVVIIIQGKSLALINPVITKAEGDVRSKEGCLSVPGYFDKVPRAKDISVSYQTTKGEIQESNATGLLSVVVQHEIDHLNGKMFVDYLSPFKQQRAKEKVRKEIKKLKKIGR